jgi:hypothetical protein
MHGCTGAKVEQKAQGMGDSCGGTGAGGANGRVFDGRTLNGIAGEYGHSRLDAVRISPPNLRKV